MSTWNGNPEAFRTYFHGMLDKDGECIPAEKVKGMPGHSFEEVCNDENFGAILNEGMVPHPHQCTNENESKDTNE